MKCMKFIENYLKNLKWYDISFVKVAVFFATLFLVTAWAGFRDFVLGFQWYWYLVLAVIFAIPAFKKMFF